MPGTTPNRHYPYPLGADTINPPRDIKALAEAVDADFSAQVTQTDLATALTGYLRLSTGGTVAGQVVIDVPGSGPDMSLRNAGDVPYIEFRNHAATQRLGFIQGSVTQQIYNIDNAAGFHLFRVNNVEKFRVSPTGGILSGALTISGAASIGAGLSVTGALSATGLATLSGGANLGGTVTLTGQLNGEGAHLNDDLSVNGKVLVGNRMYIGGDGNQLNLIDTVVTTAGTSFDTLINFYGQGTTTAPGTRAGYIGYAGNATLNIVNQAAGSIILSATADIHMQADQTIFYAGGAERGRAQASFMWGKTAGGTAVPGVELFEGGTIYSTTSSSSTPNMLLRHNTNLDGEAYIQFADASGGLVSAIGQDTVSPVGIRINNCTVTAPSDYRMKDELGPVVDALARLMEMQPKHLAWKDGGAEFDGFIAHELAAVVPDAVFGEKDGPEMQQLDQTKLIPLLIAAVQDLAAEVASLKAGA